LGRTTAWTYDRAGNPTSLTLPDGRRTAAEYDHRGLPLRIVAPDGGVLRQTFDIRGNRTSITDAAGATTRFAHDADGRRTTVTDACGAVTSVGRDASGLPRSVTDPLGAVTRYERDVFGRPLAVTDPLGAVTSLHWTAEGRLSQRTEPDGAQEAWTYDAAGNCVTHTDHAGQTVAYQYTPSGLLAARIGPDGARHAFTYDRAARLTTVTDPRGLSWTYGYDPAGNRVSETDWDGRRVDCAFDLAGDLTARTNSAGVTTRFERDEAGRVIRKDVAGTATVYTYDAAGQLVGAEDDGSSITVVRDGAGRAVEETSDGRTTTYAYDAGGRCTARRTSTHAGSRRTYDAAGRLRRLETDAGSLTFTYDGVGRPTGTRIGEGAEISRSFDLRGRCTTRRISGAGADGTLAESYSYGADSGLAAVMEAYGKTAPTVLVRDTAGRVTSVRTAYGTEEYAYDPAGNQVRATWPAMYRGQEAGGSREYAGTRLVRAGGVHYEHDALGRVVQRKAPSASGSPDIWHYAWDAGDRLTSVTTPDGAVWHYTYDPLGRRTSKRRMAPDGRAVAEETLFTWDGPNLCEEIIRSGATDTRAVLTWDYLGDTVLCQTERLLDASGRVLDAHFFAVVTSASAAPVALVDESGSVAWRARCTLTGLTAWAVGGSAYIPLRMSGRYEDPESRLQIGLAGVYDPQTAQCLTPEPRPAQVPSPHRPATAAGGDPAVCPAARCAVGHGAPRAERRDRPLPGTGEAWIGQQHCCPSESPSNAPEGVLAPREQYEGLPTLPPRKGY
jgi:YD repeat-containing protein